MDSPVPFAARTVSRIPVPIRKVKPPMYVKNQVRGASILATSSVRESGELYPSGRSRSFIFRAPLGYKGTDLGQSRVRESTSTNLCGDGSRTPILGLRAIHPQHLTPFQQDKLLAQEWTLLPTEEPLSPEVRADVIEDLKAQFWTTQFRTYQEKLSLMWKTVPEDYLAVMLLQSPSEPPPFRCDQLETFCNKATTAYILPFMKWQSRYPKLHLACIDNTWLRYFNQMPKMDFGYYFSCPIRVSESGPSTIDEIVRIHAMLCDQASKILVEPELAQAHRAQYGPASAAEFLLKEDAIHYKIFPLCRALIILIDRFEPDADWSDYREPFTPFKSARKETLLLVRTGDESGLSAPIEFDPIRSKSCPLELQGLGISASNVIRVTVATAVEFIIGLLSREETAFPDVKDNTQDTSLCRQRTISFDKGHVCLSADAYADKIMKAADEKGIDKIWETWKVVRRVKARARGESFYEHEFQPHNTIRHIWNLYGPDRGRPRFYAELGCDATSLPSITTAQTG